LSNTFKTTNAKNKKKKKKKKNKKKAILGQSRETISLPTKKIFKITYYAYIHIYILTRSFSH